MRACGNLSAGTFGELLGAPVFHLERLHESWGYFGWKLLPLSLGELWAIYVGVFLCCLGLAVRCARLLARREWMESTQVAGLAYLVAAVLLMYGAMIYYGTLNILTQARYVFPVAPATAQLSLLGCRLWRPVGCCAWPSGYGGVKVAIGAPPHPLWAGLLVR